MTMRWRMLRVIMIVGMFSISGRVGLCMLVIMVHVIRLMKALNMAPCFKKARGLKRKIQEQHEYVEKYREAHVSTKG
ncbi:MAG TPA: hypothetical protein VE954_06190 [Oligoflexus sp.]|uniref:hypothetical protein n=1 Tax=Oligoflexus sp. TaxID=1971216 RepID=UPI002D6EDC63|nr:hypothetical protein [Oligoflexus sp.]HYX32684.1 hypothetical protein [Oligoflexus sp.]